MHFWPVPTAAVSSPGVAGGQHADGVASADSDTVARAPTPAVESARVAGDAQVETSDAGEARTVGGDTPREAREG